MRMKWDTEIGRTQERVGHSHPEKARQGETIQYIGRTSRSMDMGGMGSDIVEIIRNGKTEFVDRKDLVD